MSEWQDVPQAKLRRSQATPRTAKLRLVPMGRSGAISSLVLTLPPELAAEFGWTKGTPLGIALGQGRTAGWLRVARDPLGRKMRAFANNDRLGVYFLPPPEWRHLQAPSLPAEHRIQGDALLIEIPWDMDALAQPAEEAEA